MHPNTDRLAEEFADEVAACLNNSRKVGLILDRFFPGAQISLYVKVLPSDKPVAEEPAKTTVEVKALLPHPSLISSLQDPDHEEMDRGFLKGLGIEADK